MNHHDSGIISQRSSVPTVVHAIDEPQFSYLRLDRNKYRVVDDDDIETNKISAPPKSIFNASDAQHVMLDWLNTKDWSIPTIPEYYCLERASLKVPKGVSIKLVLMRICKVLYMKSVKSVYRPNIGRIDCYFASSMLKFVVQLWKCNICSGYPSYLLEVQRRRGCSIEMKRIRKHLFLVVMDGVNEQKIKPVSMSKRKSAKLQSSDICSESHSREIKPGGMLSFESSSFNKDLQCEGSVITNAIESCLYLLESALSDERLLGMEKLKHLTDSASVHPQHSNFVSQLLLTGKGCLGKRLQSNLVKWIIHAYNVDSDYDNQYESDDDKLLFHLNPMKSLALVVLSNILQQSDPVCKSIHEVLLCDKLYRIVEKSLVQNIERAHNLPEEAALSARCLSKFLSYDTIALGRAVATWDKLAQALVGAHCYGKAHHLLLEKEIENLMDLLKSKNTQDT